jgi:hypothetical protein
MSIDPLAFKTWEAILRPSEKGLFMFIFAVISLHDKLLQNAYYAPRFPVCLISIPQLAHDTNESSNLCTDRNRSIFAWEDVQVTVTHPSALEVPFMGAHLGDPIYSAFYSLCVLAQNPFSRDNESDMGDGNYHCFQVMINLLFEILQVSVV